jgi:hypothetical protein
VIFVARGKGSLIVIVLVLLLVLDLLKVAAKGAWNLREALLPPSLAYVGEASRFAGSLEAKRDASPTLPLRRAEATPFKDIDDEHEGEDEDD